MKVHALAAVEVAQLLCQDATIVSKHTSRQDGRVPE